MTRFLSVVITATMMICWIQAAHAQLLFSLSPSVQRAVPGGAVTFSGTLTNSGVNDLFLNGYTVTPLDSAITLDDTKFYANVPLSLPGGGTWTGGIFDISIGPSAPVQDYTGVFTILGGSDGSAQDPLAGQSFTVSVKAPTDVPEPGEFVLMVSLLVGSLMMRRRYRSAARIHE